LKQVLKFITKFDAEPRKGLPDYTVVTSTNKLEHKTVSSKQSACRHPNVLDVQKHFTNKIQSCSFLSYHLRLNMLSLSSFQHRRTITVTVTDLSTLHSLVSGQHIFTLSPHLQQIPPSITRGHNLKIVIPFVLFSSSKQNFLSRTAPIWNSLASSILAAHTTHTFRRFLSAHLPDSHRATPFS